MNKKMALILALALIALALFWVSTPDRVAKETQRTDELIRSMDRLSEEVTGRVKSIDTRVKNEVEVIRRETKKHVDALPADRVADGLNDLVSEWRREQD